VKKGIGYLKLMRPANILTAIADVIAGMAIAGYFAEEYAYFSLSTASLICLATIGLYGGGVVFNDVFDHKLDRVERPERPIPSGLISIAEASLAGTVLLTLGTAAAFMVNKYAGTLAVAISLSALIYNKWSKHNSVLGPFNMGLCRAFNLMLGVSVIPSSLIADWYFGLVPLTYIAAITMISRGEVHGSARKPLYAAAILYLIVNAMILFLAYRQKMVPVTIIFLMPFCMIIYRPLLAAVRNPSGPNIGKAVKSGVIALILMDGAWAASAGMPMVALSILSLLPLSYGLSKMFAVT
jgi:4-hydroxybenzoate polyprenyltransferase